MTTATQFEYVKLKRVTTAERDADWPPGTIPTNIALLIFNTDLETMQFTENGIWLTLPPHLATIADEQILEFDSGTKTFRPALAVPAHLLLALDAHVDTKAAVATRGAMIKGAVGVEWESLLIGSSGKYLRADGLDPSWSAILVGDLPGGAKRTLVLTARGIMPNATQGCAPAVRVEGSNGANYSVADFASGEEGSWEVVMPDNYDGGTVTFTYHWVAPTGSSASDTVIFGLKGIAYANDLAIDTALGSQVTVTDTVLAVGDVHISAESAAVTLAQGPAGGEPAIFEIERTGGTMSEEARLWLVKISYGTDNYSDE